MYEPIHGSAPDIAGKNVGQSDRHDTLGCDDAEIFFRTGKRSFAIEAAIPKVLDKGFVQKTSVGMRETKEITDEILAVL